MAEAAKKRIALVGHCGPDSYALRSAVGRFVPEADVVFARDEATLEAEVQRADLLLVNRHLDGEFGEPSGIHLIQRLHGAGRARTMLVSNFSEAQAKAEAAGAAPGFGKREMNAEATREKLRGALGLG